MLRHDAVIVRQHLKIASILLFTWRSNAYFIVMALVAAVGHEQFGITQWAIPLPAVGALGTALAIFLAFRNSSSYDRWWEARKLWGRLVNESRNFARQVTTFMTLRHAGEDVSEPDLRALHKEMIYRQIAYVNALRVHLRKQIGRLDELKPFIADAELDKLRTSKNVPAALAQTQGERLRDAREKGLIEDFRHMRLDQTMSELLNIQGGCERIKNTPLPRQYDYFPQVFLYVYAFFLPFALVEAFGWATALISVPISFIFFVLQGAGRVNENPFENRWTDTPMTTLSRTIEINLREVLGETDLPRPVELIDGVAY